MRKLPLAAALLLGLAAPASALHAQRGNRVHDIPPRPALWAGADTNSANVYYMWALQNIRVEPLKAANAFYWAERLKPGWADAMYGRRMALLMSDPQRLVDYEDGKAYVLRNPEMQAIDSLALRAAQRSPFLYAAFERQYWELYLRTVYRDIIRRETGNESSVDAEYLMRLTMSSMGPEMRAWNDYASGRFPLAAQGYEQAVRRSPRSFGLRMRLAHARFLAGDAKGAAAALSEAIAQRREDDRRDIVHVYESKAQLEFGRAMALEEAGDTAGAREAFGRALEEDLAFWPVHRHLSETALARGDTATATAELGLAVELAPGEADLRYDYGMLLIKTHKPLDGVAQLTKAVELDPYFADPHLILALLNDQAALTDDATQHYRHFLDRAPRDDARRAHAQERLTAMAAPAAP